MPPAAREELRERVARIVEPYLRRADDPLGASARVWRCVALLSAGGEQDEQDERASGDAR
jgi:hypothetical protein